MHDLDGMTQSEALSKVKRLRRDQDKLIGLVGSSPATDLLSVVKVIREHSERIRSIQGRHFPGVLSYDDQAAEDPQPTAFEMAIAKEQDVLKEAIRILDGAKEKTDEPRLLRRLITQREKMEDCLRNAIRTRTRMHIKIVRPSEQQ